MRGRKTSLVPVLTAEEVQEIERLSRSSSAPVGRVRRARAIFAVSQGNSLVQAAEIAGMTVKHVGKWCKRFIEAPPGQRLQALSDLKGRGRKPRFSPCGASEHCEDRL